MPDPPTTPRWLARPACPRCGYDQSGVVASWTSECPARGTCSECGLDFRWRDVLDGRALPPPWSFEHGGPLSAPRLGSTIARSLWPRTLWRRLEMHHPVRPARLLVVALASPLLAHLICAGARIVRQGLDAAAAGTLYAWTPPPPPRPPPPPGPGFMGFGGWAGPPPFGLPDALAIVAWPYEPTASLFSYHAGYALATVAWCAAVALAVPATIGLLRQTMRAARVRPVHLVRGVGLSVAPVTALASAAIAAPLVAYELALRGGGWSGRLPEVAPAAGWLAAALALAAWWASFTRRYLRLPHAGWVALAGAVIGALLAVIVLTVLEPQVLLRVIG